MEFAKNLKSIFEEKNSKILIFYAEFSKISIKIFKGGSIYEII